MSQDHLHRKLVAIFSTDVKGYSRLMGEDEMATVQMLKAYRETMSQLIQQHQGRVVDSPGDNLLAEFPSVVEAVQCAVEIQQALHDKNAALPPARRMEFRIGINLGDVIEDDDRLYGDGVNIAARMEGLAEGGGICISGTAYDQVENKLALAYEYLGEQEVKNIVRPVRVYRVRPLSEATAPHTPLPSPTMRPKRSRFPVVVAAVVGLLLAVGGGALWYFYVPPLPVDMTAIQQTVNELAHKPSIAVLPFTNLSADPEQEYFSDGITNDIITDLSKFRELFVIASNTAFTYKGKAVNVMEVGQTLRVRYALEGSVQKLGANVRVNAQLIDTATGHHLWAERYERGLQDLFAVQDEIIQTIVTTLAFKISAAERQRAMKKDTDNLVAYDYVLRGEEYLRPRTRDDNNKAQGMFQKALELDSLYARAYVGLGRSYEQAVIHGWSESPAQTLEHALELVQKALRLDSANASAHSRLASIYVIQGRHELGTSALQRSLALNPHDAHSYVNLGWIMLLTGRTDNAIVSLETALRFDPASLENPTNFTHLGLAYYLKGQYAEALNILEKGLTSTPNFPGLYVALAATYAQVGRAEDAAEAVNTLLRLQPFFQIDAYGTAFRNPDDRTRIVEGLRKAGL